MIATFLKIVLQFALYTNDPHWKCEVTHRDPGMHATFVLYCAQKLPDGVELVSVGRFVPDASAPNAPKRTAHAGR